MNQKRDALDLPALRALLTAKTPGEWSAGVAGNANLIAFDGDDIVGIAVDVSDRNLALICALVNAAPQLLTIAEQHALLLEAGAEFRRCSAARYDGVYPSAVRALLAAVDAARKASC